MNRLLIFAGFLLLGCAAAKKETTQSSPCKPAFANGKLFASLYQQQASEYYALCAQAYNIAKLRLDIYHAKVPGRQLAVVTDIDETVLDNSPYAVHRALEGKDYEANTWIEWTDLHNADTVPGALGFFNYAANHNVEVFYISNRSEKERSSTLINLKKFSFPYADSAHLLLRGSSSGKEPRRQAVAENYEIAVFLGDNLSDFSSLYDKQTPEKRQAAARDQFSDFGDRFILLPNPGYGDWEAALYQYNYKFDSRQKDSIIVSKVKSY